MEKQCADISEQTLTDCLYSCETPGWKYWQHWRKGCVFRRE